MRISSLSLHLLSRRQAHRSLYPPSSISSTYCSIALPVFLHKSKSSLHISTRVLNSTHRSYKFTTPLVHHLPLHYITSQHKTPTHPQIKKEFQEARDSHFTNRQVVFFIVKTCVLMISKKKLTYFVRLV